MTESAYLSHRVTVDDPLGSAGLLSQEQRDGLLLALWLLVARASRSPAEPPLTVTSACRERTDESDPEAGFDMSIDVFGVARDVSTPRRGTLSVVSENTMWSTGADGFRIDIACRVDPERQRRHPGGRVEPLDPRGS